MNTNRLVALIMCFSFLVSCTKEYIKNGYQDKISYNPNDIIEVFLNGIDNGEVNIPLYNINDEQVDEVKASIVKQHEEQKNYWWKNGYEYTKTFDYDPAKLTSGVYYFENSSPFIIKNPKKKNDVLIVYPSNTDNAYNKNGGRSSYTKPKGNILSFKRPVQFHRFAKPFFEWIMTQSFNCDYICDRDLDDYNNIRDYNIIIIPGHNEYWTRKARRNFDRFIDNGGNAIILSGNTMWWQVRYERDNMVCYKSIDDPMLEDSLKTVIWKNSFLDYSIEKSIGASFVYGGFGVQNDKGWDGYKIINGSPLFEETSIRENDILNVPTVEFDSSPLIKINNRLVLDTSIFKPYKFNLLGYDRVYRKGNKYGTLIVFQKTASSGVIINTGSTNWCSDGFTGKDGDKIKKLTYNFIDFLLKDKPVFKD